MCGIRRADRRSRRRASVSIALRHPEHVPYAMRALEARQIVNIDKPIAVNYEEAQKLKACADRHPGRLFPRQNRRFEGPFQKALQLISAGVLGRITLVKLHRACGCCRRNDWMTMTEFSGGLLTNWGPHVIDQALQFIGSPVADLWADVRSVIDIGDGDDQIKLLLRGENGVVADLEISGTNAKPGRDRNPGRARHASLRSEGRSDRDAVCRSGV
ncbi:MAG: Gfo/Idh/MocA family oxidoreductase [Victivallis sp.]